MKIKIYCDNGANIYSRREVTLDVDDLGYSAEEWGGLTDDEKWDKVSAFAMESWLQIWHEEIP